MHIDKAIEVLKGMKKHGISDIVLAAWDATQFELKNDAADWPYLSEVLEMEADWSCIHDKMQDMINYEKSLQETLDSAK